MTLLHGLNYTPSAPPRCPDPLPLDSSPDDSVTVPTPPHSEPECPVSSPHRDDTHTRQHASPCSLSTESPSTAPASHPQPSPRPSARAPRPAGAPRHCSGALAHAAPLSGEEPVEVIDDAAHVVQPRLGLREERGPRGGGARHHARRRHRPRRHRTHALCSRGLRIVIVCLLGGGGGGRGGVRGIRGRRLVGVRRVAARIGGTVASCAKRE